MNKHLIRFVALLLVPCLVADPSTVSAFTNILGRRDDRGEVRKSPADQQSLFQAEALAAVAVPFRRIRVFLAEHRPFWKHPPKRPDPQTESELYDLAKRMLNYIEPTESLSREVPIPPFEELVHEREQNGALAELFGYSENAFQRRYPDPREFQLGDFATKSSLHLSYLNRDTGESRFFEIYLPALIQLAQSQNRKTIHVLVPGSSTGEQLARIYYEFTHHLRMLRDDAHLWEGNLKDWTLDIQALENHLPTLRLAEKFLAGQEPFAWSPDDNEHPTHPNPKAYAAAIVNLLNDLGDRPRLIWQIHEKNLTNIHDLAEFKESDVVFISNISTMFNALVHHTDLDTELSFLIWEELYRWTPTWIVSNYNPESFLRSGVPRRPLRSMLIEHLTRKETRNHIYFVKPGLLLPPPQPVRSVASAAPVPRPVIPEAKKQICAALDAYAAFFTVTPHPKPENRYHDSRIMTDTRSKQEILLDARTIAGMYVDKIRGVIMATVQPEAQGRLATSVVMFKQSANGGPAQVKNAFKEIADVIDRQPSETPANGNAMRRIIVISFPPEDHQAVVTLANNLNRETQARHRTDRYLFVPHIRGAYMVTTQEGIAIQSDRFSTTAGNILALTWNEVDVFVRQNKGSNTYIMTSKDILRFQTKNEPAAPKPRNLGAAAAGFDDDALDAAIQKLQQEIEEAFRNPTHELVKEFGRRREALAQQGPTHAQGNTLVDVGTRIRELENQVFINEFLGKVAVVRASSNRAQIEELISDGAALARRAYQTPEQRKTLLRVRAELRKLAEAQASSTHSTSPAAALGHDAIRSRIARELDRLLGDPIKTAVILAAWDQEETATNRSLANGHRLLVYVNEIVDTQKASQELLKILVEGVIQRMNIIYLSVDPVAETAVKQVAEDFMAGFRSATRRRDAQLKSESSAATLSAGELPAPVSMSERTHLLTQYVGEQISKQHEVIELSVPASSHPDQQTAKFLVETARNGKALALKLSNDSTFKDINYELNAVSSILSITFKKDFSDFPFHFELHQLLLNAFRHGNQLNRSLPIFVYIDPMAQKIDILDLANPEQASTADITEAEKVRLSGSQQGIKDLSKIWTYQREPVHDPSGDKIIGSQVSITFKPRRSPTPPAGDGSTLFMPLVSVAALGLVFSGYGIGIMAGMGLFAIWAFRQAFRSFQSRKAHSDVFFGQIHPGAAQNMNRFMFPEPILRSQGVSGWGFWRGMRMAAAAMVLTVILSLTLHSAAQNLAQGKGSINPNGQTSQEQSQPGTSLTYLKNNEKLKAIPELHDISFPPIGMITSQEEERFHKAFDVIWQYAQSKDNTNTYLPDLLKSGKVELNIIKGDPNAFAGAIFGPDSKDPRKPYGYIFFRQPAIGNKEKTQFFIVFDPAVFDDTALVTSELGHEIIGHAAHEWHQTTLESSKAREQEAYKESVHFLEWVTSHHPASLTEEELNKIRTERLHAHKMHRFENGGPSPDSPEPVIPQKFDQPTQRPPLRPESHSEHPPVFKWFFLGLGGIFALAWGGEKRSNSTSTKGGIKREIDEFLIAMKQMVRRFLHLPKRRRHEISLDERIQKIAEKRIIDSALQKIKDKYEKPEVLEQTHPLDFAKFLEFKEIDDPSYPFYQGAKPLIYVSKEDLIAAETYQAQHANDIDSKPRRIVPFLNAPLTDHLGGGLYYHQGMIEHYSHRSFFVKYLEAELKKAGLERAPKYQGDFWSMGYYSHPALLDGELEFAKWMGEKELVAFIAEKNTQFHNTDIGAPAYERAAKPPMENLRFFREKLTYLISEAQKVRQAFRQSPAVPKDSSGFKMNSPWMITVIAFALGVALTPYQLNVDVKTMIGLSVLVGGIWWSRQYNKKSVPSFIQWVLISIGAALLLQWVPGGLFGLPPTYIYTQHAPPGFQLPAERISITPSFSIINLIHTVPGLVAYQSPLQSLPANAVWTVLHGVAYWWLSKKDNLLHRIARLYPILITATEIESMIASYIFGGTVDLFVYKGDRFLLGLTPREIYTALAIIPQITFYGLLFVASIRYLFRNSGPGQGGAEKRGSKTRGKNSKKQNLKGQNQRQSMPENFPALLRAA